MKLILLQCKQRLACTESRGVVNANKSQQQLHLFMIGLRAERKGRIRFGKPIRLGESLLKYSPEEWQIFDYLIVAYRIRQG